MNRFRGPQSVLCDIAALEQQILDGGACPISFTVDDRPAQLSPADANLTYCVDGTPLRVALTLEHDVAHALLRWSFVLRCDGEFKCRISNVRIGDIRVDHPDIDAATTLRCFTGGTAKHYSHNGFPPCCFKVTDHVMRGHDIFRAYDDTGRGSNECLPIWLYAQDGDGIWFGPEWQGTWNLELHRLPEYTSILFSLPYLDFVMTAGEEIHLPAFVVGAYSGDLQDGGNQVRRVIRQRYLPDCAGRAPRARKVYQTLGGHPDYLSDPSIREEIDIAARLGADAFVHCSFWQFPVGWENSGRKWWHHMGNYSAPENRYPNGIKNVADYMRKKGMDLGLWIDPRIGLQSDALDGARDVLLFFDEAFEDEARRKYNDISYDINIQPLIDLSRQEGRDYLLDHLEHMVTDCHAKWIWYDLNDDPYVFHLRPHESVDRRGVLELQYFQGMDAVFNEFRMRHPDVWIEMCASGGRMINLAVLAYSHSLWLTDYTGPDADIASCIRTGANAILPAALNHQSFYLDKATQAAGANETLAHIAGHYGVSQGLIDYPEDVLQVLQSTGDAWSRVNHCYDGDFYMLTPFAQSRADWQAWQFHDPGSGNSVICIQRLRDCDKTAAVILPRIPIPDQLEQLVGDATIKPIGRQVQIDFGTERSVLLYA